MLLLLFIAQSTASFTTDYQHPNSFFVLFGNPLEFVLNNKLFKTYPNISTLT